MSDDFTICVDEFLDWRDSALHKEGDKFRGVLLVEFRRWLVRVDAYEGAPVSDRTLARVFGVHHRLIAQARRGARWQARNPLMRAWIAAGCYLEDAPVQAVVDWDAAIRRGERESVRELLDAAVRADEAPPAAAPAPVDAAAAAAGDAARWWDAPDGADEGAVIPAALGRMASGVITRASAASPPAPAASAPSASPKPKPVAAPALNPKPKPASPRRPYVARAARPQPPKRKGLFGRLLGGGGRKGKAYGVSRVNPKPKPKPPRANGE